jgi:uncharacterized membrane protein YoaK (UPF0700 family)
MTGNVVFVGFALAGASGFSLSASLSALAGFLVGAAVGGIAVERLGGHRGRLVVVVTGAELGLVLAALLAAAIVSPHREPPPRHRSAGRHAALLGLAMGAQNAAVPQLKVFDLTAAVLTMTLTGIAADFRQRDRFAIVRRLLAVGAMLAGATAGAIIVLQVSDVAALSLAAALLAVVVVCAIAGSRAPAPWHAT